MPRFIESLTASRASATWLLLVLTLLSLAWVSTAHAQTTSADPGPVDPVPVGIAAQCTELTATTGELASALYPGKPASSLLNKLTGKACARTKVAIEFCGTPTATGAAQVPTPEEVTLTTEQVSGHYQDLLRKRKLLKQVQSNLPEQEKLLKDAGSADKQRLQDNVNRLRTAKDELTPDIQKLESMPKLLCERKGSDREAISGTSATPLALQDTILRSLSEFISSRLRAELAFALENRLLTKLCNASEAKHLLPATCDLLALRKDKNDGFQAWGLIKASFEADLDELPANVTDILLSEARFSSSYATDARSMLTLAIDLFAKAARGEDITAALIALREDVPKAEVLDCKTNKTAGCVVILVSTAAQAMSHALSTPLANDAGFDLYAKVVLANMIKLEPRVGEMLPLAKLSERLEAFRKLRLELERLSKLVSDASADAKKITEAMRSISEVVRYAAELWYEPTASQIVCNNEVTPGCLKWIAGRLDKAADLAEHVRVRNYAAALVDAMAIAREFDAKVPAWLTTHVSFAAELASAKTAEDAKEVIESAALPVGYYEAKRVDDAFSVTLTALPGVSGGGEWLLDGDLDAGSTAAPQLGFFAPVGVDFTWGFGVYSFGAFLSIIDVGALVNFRLDTADIEDSDGNAAASVDPEPKVGFAQVVSPGAYITHGIYKTPLVVGVGVAMTPGLRKLEDLQEGSGFNATAMRASAFLSVDVSILPLTAQK